MDSEAPLKRKIPAGIAIRSILYSIIIVFLLGLNKLLPDNELVSTYVVGPFGLVIVFWLALLFFTIWKFEKWMAKEK